MAVKIIYTITTLKSLKRAIGHLNTVKRAIAKREQERDAAHADIDEQADKDLDTLLKEHAAILSGVWQFVLKHMAKLFGHKSTISFARAVITKTPSVATEVLDEALLLKALKALGADYAIQKKESPMVSVINAHPELIKQLETDYPGALRRNRFVNFKLDYLPRGKKDRVGASLTPEKYQVSHPDSD